MRSYSRIKRGMMFWFDPSKVYGQNNRFFGTNQSSTPSHIQNYNRPWLVVSSDASNFSTTMCTIVPCTSEEKSKSPWHVKFSCEGKVCTILVDQIRTVDMEALGDFYLCLGDDIMRRVAKALRMYLCDGGNHQAVDLSGENKETPEKQNKDIPNTENPLENLESPPVEEKPIGESVRLDCKNDEVEKPMETRVSSKYIKDQSGMSQIDKFNARYGIKTEEKSSTCLDCKSDEPEKLMKSVRVKWDKDKCTAYIEYANTHSIEETMKEWSIKDRKAVSQRKFYCKKFLENLQNNL